MARPAGAVVDTTTLTAARVDVGARIGWTLRMARLTTGTSGGAMVARLADLGVRVSEPTISGVERASVPPTNHLVRGYEQALAMAPGSLRGMVAMLSRTFGEAVAAGPRHVELATLSERYERVASDGQATGGDWLDLAEIMTVPGVLTPVSVVLPLVHRLQSELARSVGPAYLGRYEALTRFRASVYAEQVQDAVAEAVTTPYAMAVIDRVIVLSEHYTPATFDLLTGWLSHPDPSVARGAAMALVNYRTPHALKAVDWTPLVEPFVAAYNGVSDDARRHASLSSLFRNLPRSVRVQVGDRLVRPVAVLDRPRDWTTGRRNRQLGECTRIAEAITEALGVPEQPMLARLLFEALFDFRPDRQFTSAMTLGLLPCHELIAEALLGLADSTTDGGTRQGVLNLAMSLSAPASERVALAWLDSDDEDKQADALVAAAHAGVHVPASRLTELATGAGPRRERAVYAAGMTDHPVLREWAGGSADGWLSGSAHWWMSEGTRVVS
ncbi:MAG: HEAT repeat domain-containing protein [Angustibacter sp.]